jgi:predicted metal-dependent phosphoesterase TrpH
MSSKIDMHTHTTASDGACTPTENVRFAKEAGLVALAITDHDTMAGIHEAVEAGNALGIRVIPGVEVSTAIGRQDIHILGYNMDMSNTAFQAFLSDQQHVRGRRNQQLVARLNELGVDVTIEEILRETPTLQGHADAIGRPHFAQALIRRGLVGSTQEAFEVYLMLGGLAFVGIARVEPEVAIDQIRAAGGKAVLAHPGLYRKDEDVRRVLNYGIDGIEAYHSDHTPEQEAYFVELSKQYGIVATAGSDFHGTRNGELFHGPIGYRSVLLDAVEGIVGRVV